MSQASTLKVLQYPYDALDNLTGGRAGMRQVARWPGSALVWIMGERGNRAHAELLRTRPGGLALIVILPSPEHIEAHQDLVPLLTKCRPAGYLPNHPGPEASDLAQVLRRPPSDLAADVTEIRDQSSNISLRTARTLLKVGEEIRPRRLRDVASDRGSHSP